MNIQYHFEHITDVLKDDLKNYARRRFEHLENFLQSFQEDNKMLKIDIEHHERHDEYEVKCTLTLGGKVLHHTEVTHNPNEAIDKSESNLTRQAKKAVELMRKKPHVSGEEPKSAEDEAIEEMEKFNQ